MTQIREGLSPHRRASGRVQFHSRDRQLSHPPDSLAEDVHSMLHPLLLRICTHSEPLLCVEDDGIDVTSFIGQLLYEALEKFARNDLFCIPKAAVEGACC